MNCREAQNRILRGDVDDSVAAHVQECESCAELAASDARLARALEGARGEDGTADGDLDELMASIEAEDESLRGRLRALPSRQRLALLFVAAISVGAVYFAVWRRPDWAVYPMARMMLIALSLLAATAVGVLLALPRYFRRGASALLRAAAVLFLFAVAFLPAILPEVHEAHPAQPANFWVGIAKCTGVGTVAAVPVAALVWALKRNDGLEWWSTLAAAMVAAVGANLALQIHCPVVDPMHILLSHSALTVVYAVVAWILVKIAR